MKGYSAKSDLTPVVLAALCCLAAAGCTSDGGGPNLSLEDSVQPPPARSAGLDRTATGSLSKDATAAPPLVALPADLGTPAGVRTRAFADGMRQDIALRGGALKTVGDGITVIVRTTRQPTLDESVPLFKPTEGGIRSELGAQFPHIAMQVAGRESSNAYGPYGLALGRATGDVRCLYMWQWIDANRLPRSADITGPASIRVRICRAGTTFDAMAASLDHLVIGAEAAASAPGPAEERSQVIVAAGAEATPVDPAPVAVEKRRAPRRVRRPVAPVDADRREIIAPVAGGGPQFLASQPAAAAYAPASQPGASAGSTLPGDLPPQAYLGPKGSPKPPRTEGSF